MATEQSERIKAALLRAKASRQSSIAPILESAEEPEDAANLKNSAEPRESAVIEDETSSIETPLSETTGENEVETSLPEPLEGVETTLPLVAASEQDRVALFDEETASDPKPASTPSPRFALEDALASRPRIDAGGTNNPSRLTRNILILGGVIALAGLSLFFLKDRLWPESKPNRAGAEFPLQMQVESQGNGIINIRWNPRSAAVIQARDGRLVIAERDQQTRTIALTPEQLQIGHLYYQSSVERVEFRLEIVDRSGQVAKESVLALSSAASAEPSAGPPVAPGREQPSVESAKQQNAPPVSTPSESTHAAQTAAAAKITPAPQQPIRQPLRSFAPPPTQRKPADARAVLPDDAPPVVTAGGSVLPPPVNLPEAAAVRLPAPQVKEPSRKTGGELQAPKLLRRVSPVYPPSALSANIQGRVRFTATIGKDGTIRNVQAVSGPPVLIPAATAAVKQWVYQPMMLNGEPTEVVTQIDVNFALHQ